MALATRQNCFSPAFIWMIGRGPLEGGGIFEIDGELVGPGNPGNKIFLANREHALDETGNFWPILFHAFHDERSGRASIHLKLGEAVHVRVVPVKAGRLRERNGGVVLEGVVDSGLNQGFEHIVLMQTGGMLSPWK